MAEIKTPLFALEQGKPYMPKGDGEVVIRSEHTLSDILRYAIEQAGGADGIDGLLCEIREDN